MAEPVTVEALVAYAGQISEDAQRIRAVSELQHQFVHADENTAIETESGPLPSLAKWRKDLGTLETQLSDPDIGSEIVAWKRTDLYTAIKTARLALSGLVVNIWEYAEDAIGYDPTGAVPYWQWDWTPATAAASYYVKSKGGGTVRYPSGAYPHRIMTKLHSVSWDGDGSSSTFITALPVTTTGHYGLIEVEAGAVSASHMSDMHIMGSATPGFALAPVNSTQWGMYFKAKWDAAYQHGGLWYSNFTNVRISNFNKGIWTRGGYTNLHYQRPIQFLKFYQFFVQVPNGGEAIRMTGQHGQIDFIGGSGEGRDGAVALRCVTIDFDPDPATMADNNSGHGESTAHVAGVDHAVLAPINVTFGGKFSFQKAQEGLYGRGCRAVVVERCWVEDIGKFVTLTGSGQAVVTKNHLANAADGSKFGSPGSGYLYKCGSAAGIDFAEDNEIQGVVDNYMDPSTNYNDCQSLNLKGMLSGNPAGKFKAAGFKTLTLDGGVVDLLGHKFATVNPSLSDPLLKLSNLAATAAPGETVRLRPLIGPITLTNTGNISLNNLTEFTVPQNGVVTLLRIPQVVGAVEWVFVGCTPSMGTAAPADGFYYAAGFERERSNPAAGATMGWKCVTGGISGSTAVFKNKPNLST